MSLDEVCNVFAQFYNRFAERGNNTGEISKLIDKYRWTTWNDLAPQSYLHILFSDFRGMEELTDWLINNHILYFCKASKNAMLVYKYIEKNPIIKIPSVADELNSSFNTAAKVVEAMVGCGILKTDEQPIL